MANYPIKILIDEQGKEFVPFVNTDVVYFPDGSTLSNALDTKADKTTMASELDKKADKATTLEGYGISDAYTKTQIDEKLASVYDYRGSVDTKADLLAITGQKKGDVWNVLTDESTITEDHPEPETGVNYAWDGKAWDKLGMTIDLSAYETKENAKAYLTTNNIKAGENVQIAKSGNDNTFDIKIADNLTTNDSHAALSAEQGRIINENLMKPLANGQTNQVLAKVSDSSYDMAWVKAADPNSIIGDGSIVKIIEVTYDEYLALQDAGQIDPDVEYHIADYEGDNISTIGETAIQTMIDRSIQDHVTATVPNQEQPVHANATTEAAGFMSATDKTKLDSVSLNAVSKEDLATELATIVPEATIDSKIATATEDFISETEIDGKINTATSDKINSTQAQTLIDNSTKDFVTNTEAQALVSNGVADKITSAQAQTLIDNKVANYLPLSGGTLTGTLTSPYNNLLIAGNEFNLVPASNTAGNMYFNYRSGDSSGSNTSVAIKDYYFADGQRNLDTTLHATNFSGTAAKATADGNGNNIATTYKTKGDFAVIEGSYTLTANTQENLEQDYDMQTQWQIDFPTGFNKDNCVCLCFGVKGYADRCYAYGYNTSAAMGMIRGTVERTITLGWNQDTTKINLEAYNMATSAKTLWYRIVLMKI